MILLDYAMKLAPYADLIEPPPPSSAEYVKQLHPDEPRHLGEIAAYYGVNPHPESAHSAGYDAEMTGRAYQAMVREMSQRTIAEVKELADADAQR